MAMKRTEPQFISGRVLFANLKEPRANKQNPNQKPTYQITLLIEGKELKKAQAMVSEALKLEFGDKIPRKWNNPVREADNGDTRDSGVPLSENYPDAEGLHYVTFSTQFFSWMTGIVNAKGKSVSTPDIIYSGCYATVYADACPYPAKDVGKAGVLFGLTAVRHDKDGDPIASVGGGVKSAKDVFGGGKEDDDETEEQGGEEEVPAPPRRRR